jgi:acyl carrier protein
MYICGNDYISALAEQKVVKVAQVETPGSITSRFMDILADEVGLTKDELPDDKLFVDIGVDSLPMLIISARVQGELNRSTGFDTFIKYPWIGAFKAYLGSSQAGETADI